MQKHLPIFAFHISLGSSKARRALENTGRLFDRTGKLNMKKAKILGNKIYWRKGGGGAGSVQNLTCVFCEQTFFLFCSNKNHFMVKKKFVRYSLQMQLISSSKY